MLAMTAENFLAASKAPPPSECLQSPLHDMDRNNNASVRVTLLIGDSHERNQVETYCMHEQSTVRHMCACMQCRACYSSTRNTLLLNFFTFGMLTPRHTHISYHVYEAIREPTSSRQRMTELLPRLLEELKISQIHSIQLNVGLWDAFSVDDHRAEVGSLERLRSGVWFARTRQLILSAQALGSRYGSPAVLWRNAPTQLQRDRPIVHADLLEISALGVAAACSTRIPLVDWRAYVCRVLQAAEQRPLSSRRPCGGAAWCTVFKNDMLHLLPEHYAALTHSVLDYRGNATGGSGGGRSGGGGSGGGGSSGGGPGSAGGGASSSSDGSSSLVQDACEAASLRQHLHGECIKPAPPAPPSFPPGFIASPPPPPWPQPPEPSPPPPLHVTYLG